MIECLRELEKKYLAILYYELKLLKNNARRMDNSNKNDIFAGE